MPIALVGLFGSMALQAKKWIEKRKDLVSVGPVVENHGFNNSATNEAISSVCHSLGYVAMCLFFSAIPYFFSLLSSEWNEVNLFNAKEIFMYFLTSIIFPSLFYLGNVDLRKFVKDLLKDVFLNLFEI